MRVRKLTARSLAGALGLLLALSLVLVPAPALASMPEMGHIFWGHVTIGGEPVDVGTTIIASVPDGPDYSTETEAEGIFGVLIEPDGTETPEKDGAYVGDLIEFYIDGDPAQLYDVDAGGEPLDSYPFEIQGLTELDLTVPEATPPTVLSTVPEADATDVALDAEVSVTFDEAIQAGDNFHSIDISVATGLGASTDGATLTIAHDAFDYETLYTVTIPAGAVNDLAGNPLAEAEVWSFTTTPVQYELIVNSTAGGEVTAPGEGVQGPYDSEAEVPLLAVAVEGYVFVNWTGDEVCTAAIDNVLEADTVIIMNGNYEITANFEEGLTYTLFSGSSDGGSVTQPGEGNFYYPAGTTVTLLAVADEDYVLGRWTGEVADANAASTTITMDDDEVVRANFVEFSAPENVGVTDADEGVESVIVTTEPVGELDVTEMPEGIYPQEAYVVEPTGTGSFTLAFTDVSDASDIVVYKVVDGIWTLLEEVTVVGTTIEVTMDCADPILVFAYVPPDFITLTAGWNLLSTPVKLAADSDSLEQILGESMASIEIAYGWDDVNGLWVLLTNDYELLPLYAIYLKVSSGAEAEVDFIPSELLSWPPSRDLEPGLNLIGIAPAVGEFGFPDRPLDVALISIAELEGGLRGYTMVISPSHNQTGWAYGLGDEIRDLVPCKGYWVVMENADTLYGSSTTPLE